MQDWHSALDPKGVHAALIHRLGTLMYGLSAVVFLVVVGALAIAALRRRPPADVGLEHPAGGRRLMLPIVTAAGATVAILLCVLLFDYRAGSAYTSRPPGVPLQIQVIGNQWWWDVQYRDPYPPNKVTTANEIRVPVGRSVVLLLQSNDVIHSFWVPSLVGKRDLFPGKMTSLWFRADTPGIYRGLCAEYCGYQHAKMNFQVIAEPTDSFERWLSRQRDTAATPTEAIARHGQDVFLAGSCAMCHAIRGTPAGGSVGPDLTHLATRRTIAAGAMRNTVGNLSAWIADPQAIKPGVRMPATPLRPRDLTALVDYLETLK